MMDQLGIKALRPGPSGDEKAPNPANYDESKANPYPNLPDPLTLNNGTKVTTAKMWWDERRPQLVEMFEENVYGRLPANLPKVTWTVTAVDHEMIGFGNPVIAKDIIGEVDNSSDPSIKVKIHMTLVVPANAKGPVPVLMMFGRAGFPSPARTERRRIRPHQRGLESGAGAAGSVAQGCLCRPSRMAASQERLRLRFRN